MRMELIAQRSGVHRSSIYRRWTNAAGIAADLADEFDAGQIVPDTGDLEGDLRALAEQLAQRLAGDGAALVRSLLAWPDDEVRTVMSRFWEQRRAVIAATLARHESPGDPAQVLRLLAGPLHYQAVIEGQPVSPETISNAVCAALSLARHQPTLAGQRPSASASAPMVVDSP